MRPERLFAGDRLCVGGAVQRDDADLRVKMPCGGCQDIRRALRRRSDRLRGTRKLGGYSVAFGEGALVETDEPSGIGRSFLFNPRGNPLPKLQKAIGRPVPSIWAGAREFKTLRRPGRACGGYCRDYIQTLLACSSCATIGAQASRVFSPQSVARSLWL